MRPVAILVLLLFFVVPPYLNGELNWQAYNQKIVQQTSSLVLIEFTADWCLNCKVLEKTAYSDGDVINAAQKINLLALKVDMTHVNQENRELLKKYGGNALPYAVILKDNKIIWQKSGMFTANTLLRALLRAP